MSSSTSTILQNHFTSWRCSQRIQSHALLSLEILRQSGTTQEEAFDEISLRLIVLRLSVMSVWKNDEE